MNAVFVTGTDTEVGKTVVCGLLGRFLLDAGCNAVTQKWIQTGCNGFPADIDVHLELMGKSRQDLKDFLPDVCPYRFSFPASGHLAAELEGKTIEPAKIKDSFCKLRKNFDFIIAEGIGGVLVPFDRQSLVIDIAKELELPVVIVAANKLGAINHTLLTIEAVKARGLKILGIIFNSRCEKEKTDEIILADNLRIIGTLSGEEILGRLPWSEDLSLLHKAFVPIGEKILAGLLERQQNG